MEFGSEFRSLKKGAKNGSEEPSYGCKGKLNPPHLDSLDCGRAGSSFARPVHRCSEKVGSSAGRRKRPGVHPLLSPAVSGSKNLYRCGAHPSRCPADPKP